MTAIHRKALAALRKSVRHNTPRIRKKLSRSGSKPDRAVVFAAAQYYPALKKLAKT
jgi:hypothetical protein